MKKHPGKTFLAITFLLLSPHLTGCGKAKKRTINQFSNAYLHGSNISNSTVLPLQNSPAQSFALNLVANPAPTVVVGQNISLTASYGATSQFNFRFIGTPPQGVYMASNHLGVSRVEIGSSQPTPSFEVEVTPAQMNGPSQRIRLEFTSNSSSIHPGFDSCLIQGPFAHSGENIPRVGSASVFAVSGPQQETARVIRVWTQDPLEQAHYYYNPNNFYLTFRNSGSRVIHVEAEIGTRTCRGQTSVQVIPRELTAPSNSCGVNYIAYNPQAVSCQAQGWRSTYYVFNNTCALLSVPICSVGGHYQGAFDSLSACEASIRNRTCGNSQPSHDVTTSHSIQIDSRSSDWTDTGISVTSATSLRVTVSGQVKYTRSQWAFASPIGVNLSNFQRCKAAGASSFNNVAMIGKIGVNGTPFLVGSSYQHAHSNQQTGNLYLAVNDLHCRTDNSGTFTASIVKTSHAQ